MSAAVCMLSQTREEPDSNCDSANVATSSMMESLSVVSPATIAGSTFLSWNSTTPILCASGMAVTARSKASNIAWMPLRPSGSWAMAMLLVKSRTKTTSNSKFSPLWMKKFVSA